MQIPNNDDLSEARAALHADLVIPACPLALTAERRLDERRQRGLCRYYAAAGAGGLAVGVHTTQFAIRDPRVGLLEPVLALAVEEMARADAAGGAARHTADTCGETADAGPGIKRADDAASFPMVRIAGVCGETAQAVREAEMARRLGYHAGLLSLGALRVAEEEALIAHCLAVAEVLPVIGFYLQPAAGGRLLPYGFWRRFVEIENIIAIKIAPFNRYQTLNVVRAVAEAGRDDIALYTGNDDNIVLDLLTPYAISVQGRTVERRIVGGLLGHWSVWTQRAVEQLRACRALARSGAPVPTELLRLSVEVTDANAVFFDAANGFAGCIAGLHEVLRRQGLLAGTWCLDPKAGLSPGQAAEIDRVCRAYPHLSDDAFVAANSDAWLNG